MVIDASRTFRCAHRYVVLMIAGRPTFVCAACSYRTELLPLRAASAARGPATLVNIRRAGSRYAGHAARIRRSI